MLLQYAIPTLEWVASATVGLRPVVVNYRLHGRLCRLLFQLQSLSALRPNPPKLRLQHLFQLHAQQLVLTTSVSLTAPISPGNVATYIQGLSSQNVVQTVCVNVALSLVVAPLPLPLLVLHIIWTLTMLSRESTLETSGLRHTVSSLPPKRIPTVP
jgi:hypothetical protein